MLKWSTSACIRLRSTVSFQVPDRNSLGNRLCPYVQNDRGGIDTLSTGMSRNQSFQFNVAVCFGMESHLVAKAVIAPIPKPD